MQGRVLLSIPILLLLKSTLSTLPVWNGTDGLCGLLCVVARVAHLVLLHAVVGIRMHWIHLVSKYLLKWRRTRHATLRLHLRVAILSHLGLNIPKVLVLSVVLVNPSTILKSLHRSLILVAVHLAQVKISSA